MDPPTLEVVPAEGPEGWQRLKLLGALTRETVPRAEIQVKRASGAGDQVELELSAVDRIDSAGAAFLDSMLRRAAKAGGAVRVAGAGPEVRHTLALFRWEPSREEPAPPLGMAERVGEGAVAAWRGLYDWLVLTADTIALSVAGAPRTRRVRRGAWISEGLRIGGDALPIVALIAFLVGLVVALQSAYQLRQFGANIYVANLIAVSMTREMGPLMTAIILAGRSGAAIAAEIATMKVSEEVDALETIGLNPVRYAVVPKFQGITITMPALVVYADLVGIVGGFLVALFYLDISLEAFWKQVHSALHLKDLLTGLLKSVAFAWIIVLIAAHKGFQARGGAESVGRVTTSSVVMSIFWVIVADAAFSMVFYFGD